MGLAGVEIGNHWMNDFKTTNKICGYTSFDDKFSNNNNVLKLDDMDLFEECQMQILCQAQALVGKWDIYKDIDVLLQRAPKFRTCLYRDLTQPAQDSDLTSHHRNTAANNLRFLNIYYGFSTRTFVLALNLLDRLLDHVNVHPRFLPGIATSCFLVAAGASNFQVDVEELVRLSHCGSTVSEMERMKGMILDKLSWDLEAVTPLSFLSFFLELFFHSDDGLNVLAHKLQVLLCQYQFTKYKAETMALALLAIDLEEKKLLSHRDFYRDFLELQFYCMIDTRELIECYDLIINYLGFYQSQPTKCPKPDLCRVVTRRKSLKKKPSTQMKSITYLCPIYENHILEICLSASDNDVIGRHFASSLNRVKKEQNLPKPDTEEPPPKLPIKTQGPSKKKKVPTATLR